MGALHHDSRRVRDPHGLGFALGLTLRVKRGAVELECLCDLQACAPAVRGAMRDVEIQGYRALACHFVRPLWQVDRCGFAV